MKNIDNKNLIAKAAIYDVRKAQVQMRKDQNQVLEKNQKWFEEKSQDINLENFANKLQKETEGLGNILVKDLNPIFMKYEGKGAMPYGVKFNKIAELSELITNSAKEDNNFFINIIQGNMPKGFDNKIEPKELPILGGGNFWGSSKSTVLTMAAVSVYLTMEKMWKRKDTIDFKDSSISYSFDVPEDCVNINLTSIDSFKIYHSGYSFGGARGSKKEFAPQDCGTFIEKICNTNKLSPDCTATTADLVAVYNFHQGGFFPEKWSGQENLVKLFSVNKNEDNNVVGSVFVTRTFNEQFSSSTSLGVSGHTAVILGTNDQKEFVTIGVAREMPEMEGYGLLNFSRNDSFKEESKTHKKVYVLDPTELVTKDESFTKFTDIEYFGLEDLPTIVEYYDKELVGETN
jgi:hypothetical protein